MPSFHPSLTVTEILSSGLGYTYQTEDSHARDPPPTNPLDACGGSIRKFVMNRRHWKAGRLLKCNRSENVAF